MYHELKNLLIKMELLLSEIRDNDEMVDIPVNDLNELHRSVSNSLTLMGRD